MKKKLSLAVRFIIICFLIAVFVNTLVFTAHILKGKDLTFMQAIQVFLFGLSMSALFFGAICILLFLLCLIAGMGLEKTFWLVMAVGIFATVVAHIIFKEVFYKYTNEPGYIAAIAAFAIMVSLSSQYQLFHNAELSNEKPKLQKD